MKKVITAAALGVAIAGGATVKLKVIDLSGEVELESSVVQKNGRIYVPARAFEKFFNDVVIEKGSVSISPQMAELHDELQTEGLKR